MRHGSTVQYYNNALLDIFRLLSAVRVSRLCGCLYMNCLLHKPLFALEDRRPLLTKRHESLYPILSTQNTFISLILSLLTYSPLAMQLS
jgi:hypothetical protein